MANPLNSESLKTHMFISTESYARDRESAMANLRRENALLRARLTVVEISLEAARQYISKAMLREE